MKVIKLHLKALDPLVITDGSAEGMGHRTLHYIPGNMLLGAGAAAWKRAHKGEDPDANAEFKALFLNGKVSWGNACPSLGGKPSVPVPLSFTMLKNHKGLPVEGMSQAALEDCLILNNAAPHIPEDLHLSARVKRLWPKKKLGTVKSKKLSQDFMLADSCQAVEVDEIFTMHVAIGENRTAADGQLYGYQALRSGIEFISEIICEDELEQSVLKLLEQVKTLRAGHSRAAGYGELAVIQISSAALDFNKDVKVERGELRLYFKSPYMPVHRWENPFDSLDNEFDQLPVKATIDDKTFFGAYRQVAGFNGLWQLPRRTRTVLKEGSVVVVQIHTSDPDAFLAALPPALGGQVQEGYGRYLINPPFLESETPVKAFLAAGGAQAGETADSRSSAAAAVSAKPGPGLRLLRQRSLIRQAEESAAVFVADPHVQDFLDSQRGSMAVRPSQRGNLRTLLTTSEPGAWLDKFKKVLEKTPGRQWKNAVGDDPFHDEKYKDHLDVIMKNLLSPETFLKKFSPDKLDSALKLPGGPATREELDSFNGRYMRLALLSLIKAWDQTSRKEKKQEEQNGADKAAAAGKGAGR